MYLFIYLVSGLLLLLPLLLLLLLLQDIIIMVLLLLSLRDIIIIVMKCIDVHWVANSYLRLIAIDVIISVVTIELYPLGCLLYL